MTVDACFDLSIRLSRLDDNAMKRGTATLGKAVGDLLCLSIEVCHDAQITGWSNVRETITQSVLAALMPSEVPLIRPLLQMFITEKQDTLEAAISLLVAETAEILFLPRTARSEYRHRSGGPAPYLINKLMLEYALLSRRLDTLMGVLNKSFCKTACPDPPVGCCRLLGYDLGLVPDRMLQAQELEARRHGWEMPRHPDLRKCRYHTDTGCALRLLKSPACIGAMCSAVEADLGRRFPEGPLDRFRKAMTDFRNSDIDREQVFINMQALITAGSALCRS